MPALGEAAADQGERVRLLVAVAGALVADIGGGARALHEGAAFVVVGGADLQDGARQAQPVRRVLRGDGDDLRQHLHAAAEIVLGECRVCLAPQRRERLRDRAGVLLDLGFELDRGVREVVVLEGLVGGDGGKRRKNDERGNEAGAERREHRRTSLGRTDPIRV